MFGPAQTHSRASATNNTGIPHEPRTRTKYVYDGNGLRVQKCLPNCTSPTTNTTYVFSGAKVIAEYSGGSPNREYIYSGAQLVAAVGPDAPNGGFESGLTNWSLGTVGTVTLITDSTRAHSGSNYAQLSAAANSSATVIAHDVAVRPGDQVTFGGWAYLESGGGSLVGWALQAEDSTHTGIAWYAAAPMASSPSWTFQTTTYTVPSGVAYVELYAQVWQATSATVLRVDDGYLLAASRYYHQDHLSNRLVTDLNGNILEQLGHFPFGEQWYNGSGDKLLFTTYERDSESGNDYAQARYNVSRLGRFSSPDPIAGSASDPQSLNRYSYVRNTPVLFSDPQGTCPPTVQNLQPDMLKSGDSRSGGPSPTTEDATDPEPQVGQPCGGGSPWYPFMSWGGGWGSGGGAAGLDGGYNGDDSGFGVGSPVGISPGDPFSAISASVTPTYTFTGSANFHWSDYDLDDLLDFADQGEVTLANVSFQWTSLDAQTIVMGVFGSAAGKALQLALKPDCASFLVSVGQKGILMANGMKPGAPFLPGITGNFVQSMYDNYSATGVALTAATSPLLNQPSIDPHEGMSHTYAEIKTINVNGTTASAIATYSMFNSSVLMGKAQTLLHEATHISSGALDQQLAAAAGVPNALNMSTSDASAAFQKELEKHCK